MLDHLYHIIHRKLYANLEPYPHPVKWKALLDQFILILSIVGPFSAIPQVAEIWIKKNASGVSVLSWSLYIFISFFWLFYGIVHKAKPIIINSIFWIILQILIVVGTLLYS